MILKLSAFFTLLAYNYVINLFLLRKQSNVISFIVFLIITAVPIGLGFVYRYLFHLVYSQSGVDFAITISKAAFLSVVYSLLVLVRRGLGKLVDILSRKLSSTEVNFSNVFSKTSFFYLRMILVFNCLLQFAIIFF
jgi:hypothetical protein